MRIASMAYVVASFFVMQVESGVGQVRQDTVAIVGATLIDVGNYGRSTRDLSDVIILVDNGVITSVGSKGQVRVPNGAKLIDGSGLYAIPGLIDGFGSLRTSGFSYAYLYEGVTTVLVQEAPKGADGEQQVVAVTQGPQLAKGGMIGGYQADGTQPTEHPWTRHRLEDRRLSPDQLRARIDQLASDGYREVLIGYDVWPDQLDAIISEAKKRFLSVFAELAFTTYPYAIRAGVNALLHNDRYQTGIALAQNQLPYSDDPVGMSGAPAYRDVCAAELTSDRVVAYGKQIGDAHVALMPTLSIEATADDVGVPNPWSLPAAVFVQPNDLDDPVDRTNGERPYLKNHPVDRREALKTCALHRQSLDSAFYRQGAHFLAGSGSPSFGIIPGSGLHQELQLLNKIGLTPREVLATATSNFADMLGWSDVGRIEVGRRADIVLLESDPRVSVNALGQIRVVLEGGQVIDRNALLRLGEQHGSNTPNQKVN